MTEVDVVTIVDALESIELTIGLGFLVVCIALLGLG